MADNIIVDNAALVDFTVATDDAGTAHVQLFKLASQANGSLALVPGDAIDGPYFRLGNISYTSTASARSLDVDLRSTTGSALIVTRGSQDTLPMSLIDATGSAAALTPPATISVTPTLSTTPAYSTGDSLDTTVMAFAAAVPAAGGAGYVTRLTVIDYDDLDHATGQYDFHFFRDSVTPATENTAHALSDADSAKYIGSISTTQSEYGWADHGNNKTCTVVPKPIPFVLTGTILYALGVANGAAAGVHTGSGLDVLVTVER